MESAPTLHSLDDKAIKESSLLKRARELVLKYGWNSTSYQVINPGIRHWFSKTNDAVVGFVSCHRVRVAAGAPICAQERLREVAAEFETDAARAQEKVCYFCAEARLESVYLNSPAHAKVLLGAQPVWQPKDWAKIVAGHKSLRAQLNRARNKGVTVSEWATEKAHNNPFLLRCLQEWLSAKGLPPLHFLVEPNTLARLSNRRVFVAEKGSEIAGFVLLSPIAKRNGWLFEQFIHKPGAPNGTVELMIDAAMRVLAENGYDYATLGLSPLSTRAQVKPFIIHSGFKFCSRGCANTGSDFTISTGSTPLKPNSSRKDGSPSLPFPTSPVYRSKRFTPSPRHFPETRRSNYFSAACGAP